MLALFLLWPGTVSAHANLVSSTPATNDVLRTAPPLIELAFSEPLEPVSVARVVDGQGQPVAHGRSRIAPTDPNRLLLELPSLPEGLYTVQWNVVSAADGHPSKGAVPFAIGDPTALTTPLVLPPEIPNPLAGPPLQSLAARWLTVLALTLAGGALIFSYDIGQRLRDSGLPAVARSRFGRWYWRGLYGALLLGIVVTLSTLAQLARSAGWNITSFLGSRGTALLGARWLLLLATLVAATWSGRQPRRMRLPIVLLLGAAFTVSWLGHSAVAVDADTHSIPTALVLSLVHLAATAAWVGGLAQLLGVFLAMRGVAQEQRLSLLSHIVPQFSRLALASVIALTITGLYSTLRNIGSIEQLWTTTYGRSLLVKLLIFGLLVVLGALNQRMLMPRLQTASPDARAARLLRGIIGLELGLGMLILLLVGSLTSVQPARGVPVAEGYAGYARIADVDLALQLQRTDDGQYVVAVTAGGLPAGVPTEVLLGTSMAHAMEQPQPTELTPVGAGRWGARGSFLSMAGIWEFDIIIRLAGRDELRHTFLVDSQLVDGPALGLWQRLSLPVYLQVAFGLLLLALLPLVAGSWVARGLPRRRWLRASQLLLVTSFLACTVPYYLGAVMRPRNPLEATPATLAQGRDLYVQNCVPCHGPTGQGDGPAARRMPVPPADFTQPHFAEHPPAQLFDWVRDGIPGRGMPGFAGTLSEDEIWQVLAYINDLNRQAQPAQQTNGGTNQSRLPVSVDR